MQGLADPSSAAVSFRGLGKSFGDKVAVYPFAFDVPRGSFYGLVGPNGAGKTTTLSMLTGLLRPDTGHAYVHGVDAWKEPLVAKKKLGVLADGMRLFDRLSGRQLITYTGRLRGMDAEVVNARVEDLLRVMDLQEAADKQVVDYSAGMHKKIALACAMIQAPQVLVLDEPFEAVDPVSSANIRDILNNYVEQGGTVLISSHVMAMVERMCTHVAVIAQGQLKAAGTVQDVCDGMTLEDRFVDLVGGRGEQEGLSWLHS
ncbi:ABC transporter ATP-binding protein [Pseudoglutamicibacter albus]|uniref:ABC transporter n=1 Tax=Pseudoglutamicibacter albus DNF00011 TaxID=1401063 RepID=A0A095YGQ1_9MICC|nr:ABC transporter ATP-binding protein [Pseudoglutamicibacter albus]KGF21382.1 ABC transporter [Pseudoglutamicibacter albus DNF00011]KGF21433.1 ABC transporter [Pseudoglutamicibacter albus DNF00011]